MLKYVSGASAGRRLMVWRSRKVPSKVPRAMQPDRRVEVEPDLLLSNSVMRLRRVPLRLPAAEGLII